MCAWAPYDHTILSMLNHWRMLNILSILGFCSFFLSLSQLKHILLDSIHFLNGRAHSSTDVDVGVVFAVFKRSALFSLFPTISIHIINFIAASGLFSLWYNIMPEWAGLGWATGWSNWVFQWCASCIAHSLTTRWSASSSHRIYISIIISATRWWFRQLWIMFVKCN